MTLTNKQNSFAETSFKQKIADSRLLKDNGQPNIRFALQKETSITQIPEVLWNRYFGDRGLQNWEGLKWLEKLFDQQFLPEHHWRFRYYLLFDECNRPLVITFFTECLIKDDIVSPRSVSRIIEKEREKKPYYMTTRSFLMGSPITSGSNIFVNLEHQQWKQGLAMLLDEVEKDQMQNGVEQILLRDFEVTEFEIKDLLLSQGFVRKEMPARNILSGISWTSPQEHLQHISCRNRVLIAKEALEHNELFDVQVFTGDSLTDQEIQYLATLCQQASVLHRDFNTFELPLAYYQQLMKHPDWEVLSLQLRDFRGQANTRKPVAVAFCYKTSNCYLPYHIGVDLNYLKTHSTYKQLIYQMVLRAGMLGKRELPLGYAAEREKRNFGAHTIPQVMYFRMADTWVDEVRVALKSQQL